MITQFNETGIQTLSTVSETMSLQRQEALFSAIAQSITGNLTVRVYVRPLQGRVHYTDQNMIVVGDDESICRAYQRNDGKEINPFLMRVKLVVHETLHALYTPYKQYEQEQISMVLEGYPIGQVRYVFDTIEDLVIESREPSIFGGWVHAAFQYGSYISFQCAPRIDTLPPERQWAAAIHNLRDTCHFESGMRFKGRITSFKAKEVWVSIKPMLERIINFSYTTSEKGGLVREIARIILDQFPTSDQLTDEELSRRPMESRLSELPKLPHDVVLQNLDGKTRETRDTSQETNAYENHASTQRNDQPAPDHTNTETQTASDMKEKAYREEDAQHNVPSDNTEEKRFESERRMSKLLRQINQYAYSIERMEQNSSVPDGLLERDFGAVFHHAEKHTGSLTVLPDDRAFYQKSILSNRRLIRSLRALFQKELKRVRDEQEYYASGRVDPVRAKAYLKKTVEVFRRPLGNSESNEAAITLRIDQSGSMSNRYSNRGRKLCDEAGELACVLTEMFTGLKISLQVAGFAEVGNQEEHDIFREFDTVHTPKEAVAKSRLNKSSTTPTGWTIYQGIHELKHRPEQNKVMILITDGYPFSKVNRRFMSIGHIRKTIRDAERDGIAFLCLLVGECEPDLHHKLFGDSLIVANQNASLAVAIAPKLKKIAKKWNQ